jgi:hypothetical protein
MARVVPFHHSLSQQAVARQSRARPSVGRVTAVGALMSLLSFVGSLAVSAGREMEFTFVAWAQARREREEDRKLWALAQSDSRLMAELVALRQRAEADTL